MRVCTKRRNRVFLERDVFELAAIRLAFEKKLPTLAICRGMQIANVAWGGTLHQHIPDMVDGTVVHYDIQVGNLKPSMSISSALPAIRCSPGLRTRRDLRPTRLIISLSIGSAAASASLHRTHDDVIEALEHDDAQAFWLATQWHPERLLDADEGRSLNILNAFIVAASVTGRAQKTSRIAYTGSIAECLQRLVG